MLPVVISGSYDWANAGAAATNRNAAAATRVFLISTSLGIQTVLPSPDVGRGGGVGYAQKCERSRAPSCRANRISASNIGSHDGKDPEERPPTSPVPRQQAQFWELGTRRLGRGAGWPRHRPHLQAGCWRTR